MKSSFPQSGRPKTPEWELAEFRKRAWQYDATLCVQVNSILDDWERQMLTNIGNRLYGERAK